MVLRGEAQKTGFDTVPALGKNESQKRKRRGFQKLEVKKTKTNSRFLKVTSYGKRIQICTANTRSVFIVQLERLPASYKNENDASLAS